MLKTEWCFPQLQWSMNSVVFTDNFKVLALGSYDRILGWDWLTKHSPMLTHWEQGWLAIKHKGETVLLQGLESQRADPGVLVLHLMRENKTPAPENNPKEVQQLLAQYATVFATPSGLTQRRQYDHKIPLIPRARPVSIRPYRLVPELKTEIEKQVKELLAQGVITHSNNAFSSPILMVRKADRSWRMVNDFRHLNAMTIKGKYLVPVIDELLDELCRGIVESSRGRGAIELGRERGFGDVGCSGDGVTRSLPSFGSRNGGETLRAAIIHYKAIYADYNESV